MSVRLEKPLATDINASEREMLNLLQGNVLKGHGRAVTVCLLLRFDAEKQADARRFLCELADRVTSAAAQLAAARAIRAADGSRSAWHTNSSRGAKPRGRRSVPDGRQAAGTCLA